MKKTSEHTLVLISKLEEKVTAFNNDLWRVIEETYENKYDPPAFEVDEDPIQKEIEQIEIQEIKNERKQEEELEMK